VKGAALESFDMVDVDFSVIIVCVLWPKLNTTGHPEPSISAGLARAITLEIKYGQARNT
jgi:hypothetical protein